MIIAEIVGGLGNQLFQYAAAKTLANHHGVPLKLDISFYEKSKRNFMLDNFSCDIAIGSLDEMVPKQNNSLWARALRYLIPKHQRVPFHEPHYHFYPKFLEAPSDTCLRGVWQSEKYFSPIKDIIRKDFLIKPQLVSHLDEKAKAMRLEDSVSVHIRRGDYLHPKVLNHIGLLSEDYYLKAISIVMKQYPNAKIHFFSDDIKWVKDYVTERNPFHYPHEFITDNVTKTDLEDFYLMQQCKHNIIANSTYSWWAAWLNNNPDKIVVAPKNWYNNAKLDYSDLVPVQWLRV